LELAFHDFRASAELGNAAGQLSLGRLYWAGEGVEQDRPAALSWWKKAAEQGNTDAQLAINEAAAAK
jgi:hypothetical protein